MSKSWSELRNFAESMFTEAAPTSFTISFQVARIFVGAAFSLALIFLFVVQRARGFLQLVVGPQCVGLGGLQRL
jgi:hypothetical protein